VEYVVALTAITSPFLFVFALIWLIMHYKDRRRAAAAIPAAVNASTSQLMQMAERMERRIDALEQILDHEAPGWRKKYHEPS
jgi:phage shock protein B